jgi:lipopolysaccharide transport system ATP-binding protein
MSDISLRVHGLGKQYRIGEHLRTYRTLRETLTEVVKAPLHRLRSAEEAGNGEAENTIWALRDVSFDMREGQVLGIIGRNGAGKTTLLKLLSRVTEPTEGYAEVYGRVGALLEVGTGFHPELTGRENIFLNGAILGMRREEIEAKLDEIVAFAEVERFIDTPVKRYSSGMYLRLAFAVAAHLEPEILVVDEVLAVGDAEFQRKCLGKMSDVSKQGRTVLFVSHNMSAILNLTQEAIVLDGGRIVHRGPSPQAVDFYLASGLSQSGQRTWRGEEVPATADPFRPIALRICNNDGLPVETVRSVEPNVIEFEYQLDDDIKGLRVGIYITTMLGEYVLNSFDTDDRDRYERYAVRAAGRYVSRCVIPPDLMNAGQYLVSVIASAYRVRRYFREDGALSFSVDAAGAPGGQWPEPRPGVVRPRLDWSIERLEPGGGGV